MMLVFKSLEKVYTTLIVLFLLTISQQVFSEESPLQPLNTSSPQATFNSFMVEMELIHEFHAGISQKSYLNSIERVLSCFDLSEIPKADREDIGRITALQLLEILNRIDLPDISDIPDKSKITAQNIDRWRIPGTEITITRLNSGEREGEFLFSLNTVERMNGFYEKVKDLPYKSGVWEGAYTRYLNIPGRLVPLKWAKIIPTWLTIPILGVAAWKLGCLIITYILTALAIYIFLRLINNYSKLSERKAGQRRLMDSILSLILILYFLLYRLFLVDIVGLRGSLQNIISNTTFIAVRLTVIYLIFVIFDIIYAFMIDSRFLQGKGINVNLVKVINQLLAFMISAIIVIRGLEYLGFHIVTLLAGLGIGGIALALAARPTLENIIGGLILFADKPVRVGELCTYENEIGKIEEIGLRSTRIRKLDDKVISIPNSLFSQMPIENISRRRKILYKSTLQFRYETTSDQLRFLLSEIRKMLLAHPKVLQDQLRLRFLGFGAYSLDIQIFAYIKSKDYEDYLVIREDINFHIMDIADECGTSFAFPSTTNYFARDDKPDQEKREHSEEKTREMVRNASLPFPNYTKEDMKELKSTLQYPPEGSIDSSKK